MSRSENVHFSAIDNTVEKTNKILKEIEDAYGWPKERRNQSYAALRAVLHPLRDRLRVEEAAHLAAQLPTLVRGLFYEGWDPAQVPVKMDRDEFLELVRIEFPFDVPGGVEPLIRTVLKALSVHVTAGQWDDITANMPKELATLLQ